MATRDRSGQTYSRLMNGRNEASVSVRSCAEKLKLKLLSAAENVHVVDMVIYIVKRNVRHASGSDRYIFIFKCNIVKLQLNNCELESS
jgi:hypothetical protein